MAGMFRGPLKKQLSKDVRLIHPHDLAKDLHAPQDSFLLLDCRPILAYNSCHITGAVNINFTCMTKRRFIAGKIALADLVTTEEGKEKFKNCFDWPTVVYDECSSDLQNLTSSNTLRLVLIALEDMGKVSYVLQGGLSEFNVLHPSLCEISLPSVRRSLSLTPTALRATTPGIRDQPLDWKTAPPVHVLSYLVLGGQKDAMSKEVFDEFKIQYVLNVTPTCPNCFEDGGVNYLRISVTDTGSQKLSDRFQEAFDFIEKARNSKSVVLIHCMAGVSRSVTLTIAYLMYHFGLSMQSAYQLVKDKRPAISPNLNFMGQLVVFERELKDVERPLKDLTSYVPTDEQEKLTESFQIEHIKSSSGSSSSNESTPSPNPQNSKKSPGFVAKNPFVLKLPMRNRKKKSASIGSTTVSSSDPATLNLKNSPTPRGEELLTDFSPSPLPTSTSSTPSTASLPTTSTSSALPTSSISLTSTTISPSLVSSGNIPVVAEKCPEGRFSKDEMVVGGVASVVGVTSAAVSRGTGMTGSPKQDSNITGRNTPVSNERLQELERHNT